MMALKGLIHVSEISWSNRPKHPSTYVSIGEELTVQVLEVDVENKRISLGLKQLQPNPWDMIIEKYKIDQKVKGTVRSVVDFGVFVDVQEEIDALIHVSDISWTKKNINPHEDFEDGQEIEAMVISLDKENQKFCLGIKQLEEDPWKNIENRFPSGAIVEGEVVRVTDFGAFVELETGIEGLIHISELSDERVNKLSNVINRGDHVKTMVISVDKEAKKIALSIKAIGKEKDEDVKEQVKQQQDEVKGATLGDKLKDFIKMGPLKSTPEK